jgi:prevent-host-death family protein
MESMPVSKFKATCLAVLQRVNRTRRPVLITRFGRPVAEVAPPRVLAARGDWLGIMAGRAAIVGDVVRPVTEEREWAAPRR